MERVSLRIEPFEVPPQDVVSRDNVTVKVNAVIYFRVIEPRLAIVEVNNFRYATSQLAQTTLRSVLGEVELDELLSQREKLNNRLQEILDQHTSPWGVKVTMVEVKQVDLPEQMIRALAGRRKQNANAAPRSSMPKANSPRRRNWPWQPRCCRSSPPPFNCAICRPWWRSARRRTPPSCSLCPSI